MRWPEPPTDPSPSGRGVGVRVLRQILALTIAALSATATANPPPPPLRLAVAANFSAPAREIAAAFESQGGGKVEIVTGATGNLFVQIVEGAPFDVFLAADRRAPEALEARGLALAGTRFTYAVGRLVLWSRDPDWVDAHGDVLRTGTFHHLAIANPIFAPYGRAALQVLDSKGVREKLEERIVRGESIAQAYEFVASGNAELGFVALSQVWHDGHFDPGSAWLVPEHLHEPIEQDAVGVAASKHPEAARAFLAFLHGEKAQAILAAHGYRAP